MFKIHKIIIFIFVSLIYLNPVQTIQFSDQSYITGDDGVIRMPINILGHVKVPGTYIVYDRIDILSLFSVAGGYLKGANLKDISIIHKDGKKTNIDVQKIIKNGFYKDSMIEIKPHDTIIVEQKVMSRLFTSSALPSIILGILNIALTLERTSDSD